MGKGDFNLTNKQKATSQSGKTPSGYGDTKRGVPQGTVLGPTQFMLCTSDLEQNLKVR